MAPSVVRIKFIDKRSDADKKTRSAADDKTNVNGMLMSQTMQGFQSPDLQVDKGEVSHGGTGGLANNGSKGQILVGSPTKRPRSISTENPPFPRTQYRSSQKSTKMPHKFPGMGGHWEELDNGEQGAWVPDSPAGVPGKEVSFDEPGFINTTSYYPEDPYSKDGFNGKGFWGYSVVRERVSIHSHKRRRSNPENTTPSSSPAAFAPVKDDPFSFPDDVKDDIQLDPIRLSSNSAEPSTIVRITRSTSPPFSIFQARWPRADATVENRIRLALLNYLQRTSFLNSQNNLAQTIIECQDMKRNPHHLGRRNRRSRITIYSDNMLLTLPAYDKLGVDTHFSRRTALLDSEGGCSDTVRLLGLDIPNLNSLAVSVSFEREVHDHSFSIDYAVVVKLEALDIAGEILRTDDGGRIASSMAYEWEQSADNTDIMVWPDILYHLRRNSKIKFDSFGDDRTDSEMNRVRETLPMPFCD